MTRFLTVDPGLNTGIALGYYDATTPYQLLERWQVHRGVYGFIEWKRRVGEDLEVDEFLYERFIFDPHADGADFSGVPIEGVIEEWGWATGKPVIQHTRADKGRLVGYPDTATTKKQRQRVRFNFLKEHSLIAAGTENDDSNDAVSHALISLRGRRHMPTMRRFWGPGAS